MEALVKTVVVVVLVMHGLGHVMGFLAAWTNVPVGFTENPWILPNYVGIQGPMGRLFGLIWLAAMAGFLAAVYGLMTGQPWWPTAAIIASIISIVAIVPWWRTVNPGSRSGALLIDLAILVLLLPAWGEQVIAYLS